MSNRALNILDCIAATLLAVSATILAILEKPTTHVVVSHVYPCYYGSTVIF